MGRTPPLPCPARVDRARAAVRSCAVGALAVLLGALSLAAGPSTPHASADAISKKRQEATRLADAIDSLNAKIELLDEDELQARENLAALRKRLDTDGNRTRDRRLSARPCYGWRRRYGAR